MNFCPLRYLCFCSAMFGYIYRRRRLLTSILAKRSCKSNNDFDTFRKNVVMYSFNYKYCSCTIQILKLFGNNARSNIYHFYISTFTLELFKLFFRIFNNSYIKNRHIVQNNSSLNINDECTIACMISFKLNHFIILSILYNIQAMTYGQYSYYLYYLFKTALKLLTNCRSY